MGKEALRKKGDLPTAITRDLAAYEQAVRALERAGQSMLF
ncbi:hypothetical protein PI125_g19194 [Phytophthora idaei]|nr:hypothetical protein PI125_g19194 [Phytophthora idaei]